MTDYRAPLADIDFVLNHVVDLAALAKLNGYQHADPDTIKGVLSEAGRFFSEVVAPTNVAGDRQGSVLVDGAVVTPGGFKDAYAKYVESGWAGVNMPEEWGGGGMPYVIGVVLQEMFKSANVAFSLCPLLTQAAIEALVEHGSDEQQGTYLEKLVTGEWTGTMCLTEPHAGSDVGALSTKAVRQEDGTYRISGQKIFITWGDQDLTENIIHLVLARTPDALPGTKGISLFIIPKFLVAPDGTLGAKNDIEIVSLEHKVGIHGSPTCVVSFGGNGDGAVGYLVGEEEHGMRYMFTMMNTARIGVGVEGLALSERAYQKAVAYALERRQGRAIGDDPTQSSLIAEHPDVRRMLMTMRSTIEAMRALIYATAAQVDLEHHAETAEERQRAAEIVALLTPVTKAWSTDRGVELTSLGIQVHGGMGYIEETGAAQYWRDSRIAPIYEGTNGIQAIDLVLRKLPMRDGAVVGEFLDSIEVTVGEMAGDLVAGRDRLAEGLTALREATVWLLEKLADGRYNDTLAGATPYLEMFGTVASGWHMARSAIAAQQMLAGREGDPHLASKITTARFYCEQLVPRVVGLLPTITAGAGPLFEVPTEALATL